MRASLQRIRSSRAIDFECPSLRQEDKVKVADGGRSICCQTIVSARMDLSHWQDICHEDRFGVVALRVEYGCKAGGWEHWFQRE